MIESCESKVANLLAQIAESNVPSEKIRMLELCVAEQEKEVQELRTEVESLKKLLAEHEELCVNFTYDDEE